jgi:hypothetical protein
MFGIAAIVIFALAFILRIAGSVHSAALSTGALLALGLACLSVHLVAGTWPLRDRRPG